VHGKVEALWIKRAHGGPMDAVDRATLVAGKGIAGNADQRGRRQVTLIDMGMWDSVTGRLGTAVDPASRRANVLVSGISLAGSRGRILRLGPCRLRINGETRPCEQMDDAAQGLRSAMSPPWGGGAYAEVLDDGIVEIGAPVEWNEDDKT
jgi:MOSC domain-containing protein YiiM